MNLVRKSPHQLHHFFDDFFHDAFSTNEISNQKISPIKIDLYEEADGYILEAEMPGFKNDEVKIEVKDGILKLEAEKNIEEEKKEKNYFYKERRYGKFQRTFHLQNLVDEEKIGAKLKDGILRVEMHKKEEKKARGVTVTVD